MGDLLQVPHSHLLPEACHKQMFVTNSFVTFKQIAF